MDFQVLSEKAKAYGQKAKKMGNDLLDAGAKKLESSKYVVENTKELTEIIKKSEPKTIVDDKTGEEKTFNHQVILIFIDTQSDYFKSLVYKLPVLITKTYSQAIVLRIVNTKMKGLDLKKYDIEQVPSLVVLENKKVTKVLQGEDSIQKVVKSPSLDIHTTINSL